MICCFLVLTPLSLMSATPTPAFEVIQEDGKFSVRRYGNLVLVRAPMGETQGDGSFGKLFGYISGKNQAGKKISMTAPVLIDPSEEQGSMSFIMPEGMEAAVVPDPEDKSLERTSLPGGKFAVYRFSGGRNDDNESKARVALDEWMKNRGLVGEGKALYAYYNPPWIPVWFRRNEVWIRLRGE
jgi:DNA gyrase inhibitor GyrI